MMRVPLSALVLGVAGLLPFIAGVLAIRGLLPGIDNPVTGYLILQSYGIAILAFMGGCFWGFAAQSDRRDWLNYALAVLPGLFAFAVVFLPDALLSLLIGFVLLQGLDVVFRARGLGPRWWLALRLPLSAVVILCLWLGWSA